MTQQSMAKMTESITQMMALMAGNTKKAQADGPNDKVAKLIKMLADGAANSMTDQDLPASTEPAVKHKQATKAIRQKCPHCRLWG